MRGPWFVRLPLLVAGAAATALVALVSAFLVPAEPVPYLSVGVLMAALTGLLPYQVGVAARSVGVAATCAASWLVVVFYFATPRGEGDLVVTGEPTGLAFLLVGCASVAFGTGLVRGGVSRAVRREQARAAARAAAAAELEPTARTEPAGEVEER